MPHWSMKYIGKPYAEADCAELAAIILRDEFNRSLNLPTMRGPNVFSLSEQIHQHQGDFAERTERPSEGDAVLMRARGRLNHIGIYCEIGGIGHVVHAMRNAGQACLHRVTELARYNLQLEGFYRWL